MDDAHLLQRAGRNLSGFHGRNRPAPRSPSRTYALHWPALPYPRRHHHPHLHRRLALLRHQSLARLPQHRPPDLTRSSSPRLAQEFLERLPIIPFPSRGQVFRLPEGKAGMIKHNLGPVALLHKFEFRDRVVTRIPATRSPGLDDSLVRHKFDLPSGDIATEERERASCFTTDLRGPGP